MHCDADGRWRKAAWLRLTAELPNADLVFVGLAIAFILLCLAYAQALEAL